MDSLKTELMDVRATTMELVIDLRYACNMRVHRPDDRPEKKDGDRWSKWAWLFDLPKEKVKQMLIELAEITKTHADHLQADINNAKNYSLQDALDETNKFLTDLRSRVSSWEASVTLGKLESLTVPDFKKDTHH